MAGQPDMVISETDSAPERLMATSVAARVLAIS